MQAIKQHRRTKKAENHTQIQAKTPVIKTSEEGLAATSQDKVEEMSS